MCIFCECFINSLTGLALRPQNWMTRPEREGQTQLGLKIQTKQSNKKAKGKSLGEEELQKQRRMDRAWQKDRRNVMKKSTFTTKSGVCQFEVDRLFQHARCAGHWERTECERMKTKQTNKQKIDNLLDIRDKHIRASAVGQWDNLHVQNCSWGVCMWTDGGNVPETLQAYGTVAKWQLSHGHTIHVMVTKPANSLAATSHGNMSHIQQTTSIQTEFSPERKWKREFNCGNVCLESTGRAN